MVRLTIMEYLASIGCQPYSKTGNTYMYFSPLREEKTPSFHVNPATNSWYDFGIGDGGGVGALILKLRRTNKIVTRNSRCCGTRCKPFSFHQKNASKQQSVYHISKLEDNRLIDYLVNKRMINRNVAVNECEEIRWMENGKERYGIAFPNNADGYEVRGAIGNYKRCVGQKAITHIKQGGRECLVFEGFIDYLSYLCYKQCASHTDESLKRYDFLILNSTAMAQNTISALSDYHRVFLFLDNDEAGQKATNLIKRDVIRCQSLSKKFAPYNDFNEWYTASFQKKQFTS